MNGPIDGHADLCHALQAASLSVTKLTLQVGRLLVANEELQMKLTACSVVAFQNTPETVQDRLTRNHIYWSPAYGDICAAIDREIAARTKADTSERARVVAYQQSRDTQQDLLDAKAELREAKKALTVLRRARTITTKAQAKASKAKPIPKVTALPIDGLEADIDADEVDGTDADRAEAAERDEV